MLSDCLLLCDKTEAQAHDRPKDMQLFREQLGLDPLLFVGSFLQLIGKVLSVAVAL